MNESGSKFAISASMTVRKKNNLGTKNGNHGKSTTLKQDRVSTMRSLATFSIFIFFFMNVFIFFFIDRRIDKAPSSGMLLPPRCSFLVAPSSSSHLPRPIRAFLESCYHTLIPSSLVSKNSFRFL